MKLKRKPNEEERKETKMDQPKKGDVFGYWTLIGEQFTRTPQGAKAFLCQCTCGTQKVITIYCLYKGSSKSCGCQRGSNITTQKREKLKKARSLQPPPRPKGFTVPQETIDKQKATFQRNRREKLNLTAPRRTGTDEPIHHT